MKLPGYFAFILSACTGCVKQPSLPADSPFNVTAILNDSAWYGTGRVLRLTEKGLAPADTRKFNLLVFTDIDYPGMGEGPNPNTDNGCTDPECTQTQSLLIYNIPLKKGRSRIATLDKRSQYRHEVAGFTYIGNSGGMNKHYTYQGRKPGWIRVTKYDKTSGWIEGRFSVSFSKDVKVNDLLSGKVPDIAGFRDGLFRIKVTDVYIPKPQSLPETPGR